MAFGGFGPHNLLEVSANEDAALLSLRVALLTMSGFCLAGVAVLLVRRRDRGRPVRRSRVVLVDAFALGLVMIAFLFVSASFDAPVRRSGGPRSRPSASHRLCSSPRC